METTRHEERTIPYVGYVDVALGACQEQRHADRGSEFTCFSFRHRNVALRCVALVADEHDAHACVGVLWCAP